ncbi:hypothetical protein DIPPA_31338 [Diplonema papillatum]|nr:hypothetical protein DIPPA_31338 [Diplonema papillatum]
MGDTSRVIGTDYEALNQHGNDARSEARYLKSLTDAGGKGGKGAKPDYSMQNAVSKGMRQQRAGGGEPAARKRPVGSSAMMSTGFDADDSGDDDAAAADEAQPKKRRVANPSDFTANPESEQSAQGAKPPAIVRDLSKTAFATGLPTSASDESVKQVLAAAGLYPVSIRILRRKASGLCRGRAFIDYATAEEAARNRALSGQITLDGATLTFEAERTEGEAPAVKPPSASVSHWLESNEAPEDHPRSLFLKSFPPAVSPELMRSTLSEFGEVEDFGFTNTRRGCVVSFKTEEGAKRALEATGFKIGSSSVHVTRSNISYSAWAGKKKAGAPKGWAKKPQKPVLQQAQAAQAAQPPQAAGKDQQAAPTAAEGGEPQEMEL